MVACSAFGRLGLSGIVDLGSAVVLCACDRIDECLVGGAD